MTPREHVLSTVLAGVLSAVLITAVAAIWQFVVGGLLRLAVPEGTVLAIDDDTCPRGWEAFDDAAGRVIVGVSPQHIYRTIGGQSRVQLSIEHMPSHQHELTRNGDPIGWGYTARGEGAGSERVDIDDGRPENEGPLLTDFVGSTQAHENMPPYIALQWCRRQ